MHVIEPSRVPFICGLDLGQTNDYSALVLLERVDTRGAWDPLYHCYRAQQTLHARLIHRFPLRTPYPDIASRVRDALWRPEVRGKANLVVDATGVGAPVVDLLRQQQTEASITPVIITSGDAETRPGSSYGVPKKDLVGAVALMMQNRGLAIPRRSRYAGTLINEMHDFRIRFHPGGHTTYGAWRERDHDDLVLATALACWKAYRLWPDFNSPQARMT